MYAQSYTNSTNISLLNRSYIPTDIVLPGIGYNSILKYNNISNILLVCYSNKVYFVSLPSLSYTSYTTDITISSCDVDQYTGDMYVFCNSSITKTIYRFTNVGIFQGTYAVYNFSSTAGLRHGSFIPYNANWIHIPQERWQYRIQKNPIAPWDKSWTYFDPWISTGWPCQIDAAYNADYTVRSVYTMRLDANGIDGYPYNKLTGTFGTRTSHYRCATYGTYGTNTWIIHNDYMIYQSGNTLYTIDTSTGSIVNTYAFPYVIRNVTVSKSTATRTAIISTTAGVFEYNPYTNICTQLTTDVAAFFVVSLK